jgi:hypothetical protein
MKSFYLNCRRFACKWRKVSSVDKSIFGLCKKGAFKYVKTYYHPLVFLFFFPLILRTPLGITMKMAWAKPHMALPFTQKQKNLEVLYQKGEVNSNMHVNITTHWEMNDMHVDITNFTWWFSSTKTLHWWHV